MVLSHAARHGCRRSSLIPLLEIYIDDEKVAYKIMLRSQDILAVCSGFITESYIDFTIIVSGARIRPEMSIEA